MKKSILLIIVLLFSMKVNSQDQSEMMKSWQESISPGEMHKLLSKMVGEWNTEMIMNDQTGKEIKSKGISKTESILGGRYFLTTQSETVMGMPFEGKGLDAYDNIAKEFISVWIDNMGTGVIVMKGYFDEKNNMLVYSGDGVDPMTKEKVTYRSMSKFENDDKLVFEMYANQGGQEAKMFTMIYYRKK